MTLKEHQDTLRTMMQQQAILRREIMKACEHAQADGFEAVGPLDNVRVTRKVTFDL